MIPGFFAAGATGGSGANLWTPQNLTVPPVLWLDWDSPTVEDSGYCAGWANSKGSAGGSFSQTTGSRRPLIDPSGAGGKRLLLFDGADDFLRSTDVSLREVYSSVTSIWAFVVAGKRAASLPDAQVLEVAAGGQFTRFGVGAGFPGSDEWLVAARRLDSVGAQVLTTSPPSLGLQMFFAQVDYASAQALASLDGQTPVVASPFLTPGSTSSTRSMRVNVGSNAAENAFGDVFVAAVLSGTGYLPSQEERQKLEGWAAWQCGLRALLPPDHPYKTQPPRA